MEVPHFEVEPVNQLPKRLIGTPYEVMMESHNHEKEYSDFKKPEMLIVKCMDARVRLRLPHDFAYVTRSAGANIDHQEFYINYAVAVANIQHIAIVGHTDCGMVKMRQKPRKTAELFAEKFDWELKKAEQYLEKNFLLYSFEDEKDFTFYEAQTLREEMKKYGVMVEPFLYDVANHQVDYLQEQRKG